MPLIDSSFSLEQILKDDSTLERDKQNGNYSLVSRFDIPAIKLGDSLSIQAINVNYSSSLNSNADLKRQLSSFDAVSIGLSQLDSACKGSGSGVVAASDRVVALPLKLGSGLKSVHILSGNLAITLQNNLPIDIDLASLPGSGSAICMVRTPGQPDIPHVGSGSQATRVGRAGSSSSTLKIQLPLAGATLNQNSVILLHTATSGSLGKSVSYSPSSTFQVDLQADAVQVGEASASLEAMPLQFEFEAALPNGTQISEGVIREFVANLQLKNDFAIRGTADISFPQLTGQQSKQALRLSVPVLPRSTQSIRLSNEGQAFVVAPDAVDKSKGNLVSSLHCVCTIHTEALPTIEDFNQYQRLAITGLISPLSFSRVSGYQSSSNESRFTFGSDLKGLQESGIVVGSADLKTIEIDCELNNATANQGYFSGTVNLLDLSGTVVATRDISPTLIAAQQSTIVHLRYSDMHLSALPARAVINGVLKAASSAFIYNDNAALRGSVCVRVPLALRVKGGSYSSQASMSVQQSIRERVHSARMIVEAHNTIPADVGFHLDFFDANDRFVQRLPQTGELRVNGYNGNGTHTASGFAVDLDSSVAARVLQCTRTRSTVSFNTAQDSYVTFNSSDKLAVRVQLQCTTIIK